MTLVSLLVLLIIEVDIKVVGISLKRSRNGDHLIQGIFLRFLLLRLLIYADDTLDYVVPGLQGRLLVELVQVPDVSEDPLKGRIPFRHEFGLEVNVSLRLSDPLKIGGSSPIEEEREDCGAWQHETPRLQVLVVHQEGWLAIVAF